LGRCKKVGGSGFELETKVKVRKIALKKRHSFYGYKITTRWYKSMLSNRLKSKDVIGQQSKGDTFAKQ